MKQAMMWLEKRQLKNDFIEDIFKDGYISGLHDTQSDLPAAIENEMPGNKWTHKLNELIEELTGINELFSAYNELHIPEPEFIYEYIQCDQNGTEVSQHNLTKQQVDELVKERSRYWARGQNKPTGTIQIKKYKKYSQIVLVDDFVSQGEFF